MKRYLILFILATQAACGETHHFETTYVPQDSDKAVVQQQPSTVPPANHGALEACAYDIAQGCLDILKRTVGLHHQSQLEALYDMLNLVCVKNRKLDVADGLDEKGARDAINNAIKRAVIETFGSTDI